MWRLIVRQLDLSVVFFLSLFQLHYYFYLWRKSKYYKKINNKLSTFFKGPSWKPGKPRLGDHSNNPKVSARRRRKSCFSSFLQDCMKTMIVFVHQLPFFPPDNDKALTSSDTSCDYINSKYCGWKKTSLFLLTIKRRLLFFNGKKFRYQDKRHLKCVFLCAGRNTGLIL